MRYLGFRKWLACVVACSCFAGAGAGSFYGNMSALADEAVSISWWICPTGGYSDESAVQAIVDAYEAAYPNVDVDFRILDEKTGTDEIAEALGTEQAPDVVLCAPEWIVTQWGGDGLMADLSDLWDEKTQGEYRSEMRDVAKNRDGVWYAVPLYRDLYTMAFNYEKFREAGVLQYLNEEAHSWKDNGFIDCVLRVHDTLEQSGADSSVVGKVYCKDENGQRAFMCFVENFFKTGLIDDFRSAYQVGHGKIRDVFSTLRKLTGKGIEYDSAMDGEDENAAFLRQEVYLTFNWSPAKQKAAEDAGFTPFPIMYPNSKNVPTLTGPIGALGVVEKDAESDAKKDAAFEFVRFLMTDEDAYTKAVLTSGCFPARRWIHGHELTNLYDGDETMALFGMLNEYYEFYDPVMEMFPELEAAWPQALREIGDGAKIKSTLKNLEKMLNEGLEERYGIHEIEVEGEEE